MSRLPKVENESDSSSESEKQSSETVNTPDDFLTASEGPSLFEIVGLLLSSDSSQDNLKLCDKPIETSLPANETSIPPNETSLSPNETSPTGINTSFPPISCDKKVSVLVSEGNIQIKACPDNVPPASVSESNQKKSKENCTNVEIEILRALAVHYTSLPSHDIKHQDILLQVLSESKNSNIPGRSNDTQLAQGHSNAEPSPVVEELKSATKTTNKALPIVQAIHEIVDQETLDVIKKNLKDKVVEKQQSEATPSSWQHQHQQQQPDLQQDSTFQQNSARLISQSNDDEASPISDVSTEQVVPRDINVYFETCKTLETLVEEDSNSDIALNNHDDAFNTFEGYLKNNHDDAFNTFEGYLKNETDAIDLETLLKDQVIDKTTFQKILSNYLKDKTVLYDAICAVNKSRIKHTSEDNIISRISGAFCGDDPALSCALQEHSINNKSEGEFIEIDSRSKSQQKDNCADEELSTYDVGTHKERSQSYNDDETLTEIQCTIPKETTDQCLTLSESKCIEKSSMKDVSVTHNVQGQYLPEDGCCLENLANVHYKDDTAIFPQPLCTTEPSCDISLINNLGSFSYDFESARVKTVNLTAEQVHVTALDVDLNNLNRFSSEPRQDIPKDERVESNLKDDAKLDNLTEDKVKVDNVKDVNVKVDSGILNNIKKDKVKNETVKVENVIRVDSNVGKSIELACSLKTDTDNFKANLSVKEISGISIEQGISLNDNSVGTGKETSLSIDSTRTNCSKNTLEVSLIYRTINTLHPKMNDKAETDSIVQKEPEKEKLSIESNYSNSDNKVKDADTTEAVLATSVAEMKKLFEQKPIMMSPPSFVQASPDDGPKTQTAREVNQSTDTAREVNQSADNPKLPYNEEPERRSSLKKEILGQIAKRSDSARPSVDLNDTTVKGQGRLEEDSKPADVKTKVAEPSASRAEEGNQHKDRIVCGKMNRDRHSLEQSHPRLCDGASNTRCSASQTVAQSCPCCCQPETITNSCCSRNAPHHHNSGQHCEQGRSSSSMHHQCSANLDQACVCNFKASQNQRDMCRACCSNLHAERNGCFTGQDKSCQKQTERNKSSHNDERDHCCTHNCCQRKNSAKCLHEDPRHCPEEVSDDPYTENDRSAQTATECFKTRIDANYTAIRICFKPNGKMKLCPEDCSCRDACTPDTSMSLASEVCIEASYLQSDSTSSGDMGNRRIKFSSQCDVAVDDNSDDERTGESRV